MSPSSLWSRSLGLTVKTAIHTLKYLLFAYRFVPHTVTGFTLFELIYGRDVRWALEMLKQGWMVGSIPEKLYMNG